jgi:PAS domain S-box-containing protein
MLRPDGRERWVVARGTVLRDGTGEPLRMVGIDLDITDRKTAADSARTALAELEGIYAAAPLGLSVLDAQCRWTRINAAMAALNGYAPEAHIGRAMRELLPDIADRVEAAHARVMRTGRPILRQEVIGKTPARPGVTRTWETSFLPLPDGSGEVVAVGVLAEELTSQRATEAALRLSAARLRLATEAGQIGVFDWDLRTGELQWDERLRAMWSLPAGAAVTLSTFFDNLHPDDVAGVRDAIAASFQPDTGGRYEAEFRVLGVLDRIERHVAARAGVWFEEGRPIRMLGTAVEVTAQRQAEAVLARDKAELERLVEARTRDLQETQAQLAHARRMDALGQLAGGIAHDFNNVLQAVHGAAGLIEKRLHDPERVRRLNQLLMEAADRGTSITRRLLAFSRRGELRAEAIDPAGLLADLREIFLHTLGSGVQVRVEADPGLPRLLADRSQLETALVNLATNARDAMAGTGSITLVADEVALQHSGNPAGAGHAETASVQPGRYIRLRVRDTGEGMPPEILARVTEPFFTTKPFGKGTGLGLAMARGFAEQSGGTLAIDSRPGQGTTVTLWLPLATTNGDDLGIPNERAIVEYPPERREGTILLVEDDAIVRGVVGAQLEAEGYTVVPAESGAAALLRLDAGETIDLVIADLSMPAMDGISVIKAVQRRYPHLPAILLTGFTNETAVSTLDVLEGAFLLLRKPVTRLELAERVAVLLEGASAARSGYPLRP